MAHFLEEFYYGNIDPQTRGYKEGSKTKENLSKLNELDRTLRERLSEEEQELLPQLAEYYLLETADTALDNFLTGFRLGARFTYDTFVSDEAPFEDLMKKG